MTLHLFRWGVPVLAVLFLACALIDRSPAVAAAPADDTALHAGMIRVDITPEKPVMLSGYRSRRELSTGVHDPLSARVVALKSGGQRLVLVSTDIIGFYDGTADQFRAAICERYGLQPGELFLCGIHTHSAPTPALSDKPHPNNHEYTLALQAKLLNGVGRALDVVHPVRIGIGVGSSAVGCNRRELQPNGTIRLGRNPYGPTDKEVLVLKVAEPGGRPLAAVFDYATHATSLGPKNLVISGDVLGLAEQYVEQVLGSDVVAPAFAGASGNIDPWFRVLPAFHTENGRVPEPVLMGNMLGAEVVQVFEGIKPAVDAAPIRTAFAALELPAKQGTEEGVPATRPLNVTVARVGEIGFVGLGCELLTEVGMAIKAQSPCKHTFVITHCNGTAGYLPPADLYEQGGYEVESSRFAPAAAEKLIAETVQLLHSLN